MHPHLTPEQRRAALIMAESNDRMSHLLNLVLAGAAVLFFFCVAPAAATWAASDRWCRGWTLSSHNRASAVETAARHSTVMVELTGVGEGQRAEKRELASATVQEVRVAVPGVPRLKTATTPSWTSVNLRTLYNKLLLRPAPFCDGTIGQVLLVELYIALFLFCLLYDTPTLRRNWRRAGCIAVAQLPWLFLFATKNTLLGLIGIGYENVNWLHRLAGRLVILGGLLHTLLFLLIAPLRLDEEVHLTGFICAVASAVLLVTSVGIFRRAFYQLFLISHILGWIVFVAALAFHVPEFARPYLFASIALYSFDAIVRIVKTRLGAATIQPLPGGMTRVQSATLDSGWRAGQHVWLRTWGGAGWHRSWETHPFTIASAPSESSASSNRRLTLLVKTTGAFTRGLSERSNLSYDSRLTTSIPCAIEGPYGGLRFLDFATCEAVILLAGGSGITSSLPLLEELVHLASKGKTCTRIVTLVWSVKATEQLEWCCEVLTELVAFARDKTELKVRVSLHVTNLSLAPLSLPAPLASPIPHSTLTHTRPDFSALINAHLSGLKIRAEHYDRPRGGGLGVGVCGPTGLVRSARMAVAKAEWGLSTAAGGIQFHSETFGW
ncbi:hypothetical protein JCM10908_005152 [Rhodotorula pacifica]|uniref:ferric reductase family protein n=1 Tax=Rhodotorula pacifica TaxID=1495444 RepID=UPI00317E9F5E